MTRFTNGDRLRRARLPCALLVAAGVMLASYGSHAAECGKLVLNDDAQNVVIGEAGSEQCFSNPSLGCFFMPYYTPRLGVCWQGPSGAWHLEVFDCDTSSTSDDWFQLETHGGDDRVAVLREEHTIGDLRLVPAGGGTGAMPCNASKLINGYVPGALAAFRSDFEFQIVAYLGEGTDLYHGSDNEDVVFTNAIATDAWLSPADNSSTDLVCTYGGDDVIYGDGDDDFTRGFEDWFDGGDGNDLCIGDYGVDGSDTSDLWRNCETVSDAYPDMYVNAIHCEDSDNPLQDWGAYEP